MAYTTINKSTDYFNTVTYSNAGDGAKAVTGVGFQPDLVWLKNRVAYNAQFHDAVRGASNGSLYTNTTAAVDTGYPISSFDSDGFTTGSQSSNASQNSASQVAWNWKANGSGSANTDGTINTTVSVNTTAGFSIVKWTGTNSNGTIGHGLGTTPSLFISKSMAGSHAWGVYHKSIGIGSTTLLNSNGASDADATYYGGTSPTSTIMGLGTANATNASGNMIGYAFAEKKGYSKFGSYTGNGNADGTFIYTGFKPAFIITKKTSSTSNWSLLDNKRLGYNVDNNRIYPNLSGAENTSDVMDILSNGFKMRSTAGDNCLLYTSPSPRD